MSTSERTGRRSGSGLFTRYHWDPETIRVFMTNHRVKPDSAIVTAETSAPADAPLTIAAEMSALRDRARRARKMHELMRKPWMRPAIFGVLLLLFLSDAIRFALRESQRGQPWLGGCLWRGLGGVAFFLFLWFMTPLLAGGRTSFAELPENFCADFARRTGGAPGKDTLDEIVHWLETRWRWFLPPRFASNYVAWAIGERRGSSVLVVVETYEPGSRANTILSFTGKIRRRQLPPGLWTRCNMFIHQARFRDAEHRRRVQGTLARMGGGAIQCPGGIYLYAVVAFVGWVGEDGPSAEIWVDLADQVVDPDFSGSPSATRALQDELALWDELMGKAGAHA